MSVQTGATLDAIEAFITVVAPDDADDWMTRLKSGTLDERATAAGELRADLDASEDAYVAATDETRWRAARRDAGNLEDGYRFLVYYQAGDFGSGNALHREPGMVRNMEEILATTPTEQRVLMISHNFHCARDRPAAGATSVEESPTVGSHLARSATWGPGFGVIAQLYQQGTHLAFTGGAEPFAATKGIELAIGEATLAPAITVATTSTWIDFDRSWAVLGNGSPAGLINPSEQFDGVIWLREASATTMRP